MNLTHETAAALLAKFYAGQTDTSEEQQLRRFLAADDCPADMLADRAVFETLASLAEVPVPDGLEARVAARLKARPRRLALRRWLPAGMVAAVAAVFLFAPLLRHGAPSVYEDTCSSPQEAAVEVQHTLNCVSATLAMGLSADDDELGPPCP